MKTLIFKSALFLLSYIFVFEGSLSAQEKSSGGVQERALQGVSGIKISGTVSVILLQGTEEKIIIEAPDKYLNAITSDVKDGILTIAGKADKADKIQVTIKDLKTIDMSGASGISCNSLLTLENLKVNLSGGSELKLKTNVGTIEVTISGAGEAKLLGKAELATFSIAGAGEIHASNFECKKCKIAISGAGEAKLNVTDEVTAAISGAGSIKYKGDPKIINKTISGSGEFEKMISDASTNDTTRFRFGEKKIIIFNESDSITEDHKHKNKNKTEMNWAGISIGTNSFMDINNRIQVPVGYDFLALKPSKSIVVNINPIEKNVRIIKGHMNIVTGLGFEINNFSFENNYHLVTDTSVVCGIEDTTTKFRKNKLTTSFLNIPILLQLNSNKDRHGRSFHVSIGVIGGVKIGSYTKQVVLENGNKDKLKTHDDFNLAPFRYGFMARIGYDKLDFFASYAMSTMFKEGQGPQLYPVSAGITLIGF